MAVSLEHPGVTYRSVSGPQPRREILLIRHRDRHRGRIQQRFVECLREFCAARSKT
jgi:DNA-binding transcriptional LysR family regulator